MINLSQLALESEGYSLIDKLRIYTEPDNYMAENMGITREFISY